MSLPLAFIALTEGSGIEKSSQSKNADIYNILILLAYQVRGTVNTESGLNRAADLQEWNYLTEGKYICMLCFFIKVNRLEHLLLRYLGTDPDFLTHSQLPLASLGRGGG